MGSSSWHRMGIRRMMGKMDIQRKDWSMRNYRLGKRDKRKVRGSRHSRPSLDRQIRITYSLGFEYAPIGLPDRRSTPEFARQNMYLKLKKRREIDKTYNFQFAIFLPKTIRRANIELLKNQ
uniref:Uncharacterized protein n=1 Tax=Cacopsylla melanoneura TaxID=428564 RepID=A0A8D9A7A6_9HEMI